MNEKKHTYQSVTPGLPPLKMVLGNVPNPDPIFGRSPFYGFMVEKPDVEAKSAVKKLIGFMKEAK